MVYIIIDDDPTGCQGLENIPMLMDARLKDLEWAFRDGAPGAFVLTNSRAVDEQTAAGRVREVVRVALDWAGHNGQHVEFISRSDSTLRGHFVAEVEAIIEETEMLPDAILFVPAFPEGGRITRDGVHYAGERPVGESIYAADPLFKYRSSNLGEWLEEKFGRAVNHIHIPGNVLRAGGAVDILNAASDGVIITSDCENESDLELLARGVEKAKSNGKRFVYRTGPSFARHLLGLPAVKQIDPEILKDCEGTGTLVVVGSHVDTTTAQVEYAKEKNPYLDMYTIPVEEVINGSFDADKLADLIAFNLRTFNGILATSREFIEGREARETAQLVSDALVDVVRGVLARCRPKTIITKGGITSDQILRKALGVHRANVLGPMSEGMISAVRYNKDGHEGQVVIFPGNVGGESRLHEVLTTVDPTPVAVIGCGAMGLPIALRAQEEYPTIGVETDPARIEALREAGLKDIRPLEDALADARMVLIAVRTTEQFLDLVEDLRPLLSKQHTVIICSTVGHEAAWEAFVQLLDTGCYMVDAPVSGGAERARNGELLIMLSGHSLSVAYCHMLLRHLSNGGKGGILRLNEGIGTAQKLKTVNQLLCGIHIAAATEALALAKSMGISTEKALIGFVSGAADSFMLRDRGPRIHRILTEELDRDFLEEDATNDDSTSVTPRYEGEIFSRLDIFEKDMGLVERAAAQSGLDLPLAKAAMARYKEGVEAGLGAYDDSALVELLMPTLIAQERARQEEQAKAWNWGSSTEESS
ncbi:MAG: four-carbon acid sugar kinase family protein [Corynebacterium sp.]|nr:four-carbon acid sugar kinase family protein [Corynebacterium sp.]